MNGATSSRLRQLLESGHLSFEAVGRWTNTSTGAVRRWSSRGVPSSHEREVAALCARARALSRRYPAPLVRRLLMLSVDARDARNLESVLVECGVDVARACVSAADSAGGRRERKRKSVSRVTMSVRG